MKNLMNLGEVLNIKEQQSIKGGWGLDIIYNVCNPDGSCPGSLVCKNGLCVDYYIK